MPEKTMLVATASRHGATRGIGDAIESALRDAGIEVTVVDLGEPADHPPSLTGFDGVVLGSGVYMGRWQKSAREFVARHGSELARMPTWLFSSGPLGKTPQPEGEGAVDIASITREFTPRDHRVFAGRLDRSELGFRERAVARAVRAPEGDFRDWDEISGWSDAIAAALLSDSS